MSDVMKATYVKGFQDAVGIVAADSDNYIAKGC